MKIPKGSILALAACGQLKNYSSVPPLWLPNTAPVVTHHIQFLRWPSWHATIDQTEPPHQPARSPDQGVP